MATGLFVTARLGSTRLPQKHLLPVGDKPILWYLLHRIATAFQTEIASGAARVVIVSSDEPENRALETHFCGIASVFYGSIHHIPLRHLQAADYFGLDTIVSIDGDDILCATEAMTAIAKRLAKGSPYVATKGLPLGMNVCGYTREFLRNSLAERSETIMETGWGRVFDETKLESIDFPKHALDAKLRYTLDYDADYAFFKSLIESQGDTVLTMPTDAIVHATISQNLQKIVEPLLDTYWENFNREIQKTK